ncbi:hypothetical protein GCM10010094_10540 [Streptomyces flaveus]|uniref:Uncharacterized protein n=1 Tax=Streptomyces flaveus TaxID=66370 RepID=A0A917QJJ0_9ACTN|nr:hypothetical protein GCM10010094_10540 [Streptomyces flaveus]
MATSIEWLGGVPYECRAGRGCPERRVASMAGDERAGLRTWGHAQWRAVRALTIPVSVHGAVRGFRMRAGEVVVTSTSAIRSVSSWEVGRITCGNGFAQAYGGSWGYVFVKPEQTRPRWLYERPMRNRGQ